MFSLVQVMKRRNKPKKKHFTSSDFDISLMQKPTEKPEVDSPSQSVVSDDSRDASRMLDEKMKKRKEMMEKKMLRKKKMLKSKSTVNRWDFSGIEPPAPLPETETAQASSEVLRPQEEVLVVSQAGQGEEKERTPRDFSNLLEFGEEEEEEVEEEEKRERRKSVYQAGLNTSQKSVMFDQSVFRPETESTRLAISSVSSVDFQCKSPAGAKPGRDTSTPFVTRSQQALSKSAVVNVVRENLGEPRVNQTTGPRLATQTGPNQPIIEGATQTSPHLEAEVGCQVTPSLADLTTAGEKSEGPAKRHHLNDLTNSLAEEVTIVLPLEEEGEETEELQQNITNSGRKNPSPISERRNEVDLEEVEEEESFVEPHQGIGPGEKEDLVEAGDVEQVKAGQGEGRGRTPMDFTNLLEFGDDEEEDGEQVEVGDGEEAEAVEDGEEAEDDVEDDVEDMEQVEDDEEKVDEVDGVEEEANLSLPTASSTKAQPSGRELRELRQATLTRYLGIQDSASPLLSPLQSPEKEKVVEKPKPRSKPKKKEDPKMIFPPKQVKFEFQRFSRYKLKAEADDVLMKASKTFLDEALRRMSGWAEERGADHIHLCDVKRMMERCGFVPSQEEDPHQRFFHEAIRDIARREHVEELIPCNLGRGEIYPPKDCWEEKGEKKKKSRKAKADKVKRLKVNIP